MNSISTDTYSAELRDKAIRPSTGEILISRIAGSDQEADLTEPPNCDGYGRIRHFRLATTPPWPTNQLPILPASHALGLAPTEVMAAQVFQNAACNWRCWYCFVPFQMLSANPRRSAWLTAQKMVDLYLAEPDRPIVIDCSGGQPDLVPEWIPWMMRALHSRGLAESVYLWSDDNLSNDYFWRFLEPSDRQMLASSAQYGRVCCFKGFDENSFAFNTKASPELFRRQFDLFGRLLNLGIDLYAYATFTGPNDTNLASAMSAFVDRLQELDPKLPLRLVPLRIEAFGVVVPRIRDQHRVALAVQDEAVEQWNAQLAARFSSADRQRPMPLVRMQRRS